MTRKSLPNVLYAFLWATVWGVLPPAADAGPKLSPHRRPLLPYPVRRQPVKPDWAFEIRITRIDVGDAGLPVVSTILASSSNRDDQLAGLRAQAKRGASIFQVSCGPTLRVAQDVIGAREDGQGAARLSVTARPHLNVEGSEVVDVALEQPTVDGNSAGLSLRNSLVFENGDTKLLGETVRTNGVRRRFYATVFFPLRPASCLR